MNYDTLFDFLLDNIKTLFYPEEWIQLDLTLSKSELISILMIDRYGEITMSEVSAHILVPMSTATGIMDRLVKKGLAKRVRSESDRRTVVIRLTDQGQELIREFKNKLDLYLGKINNVLSEEEKSAAIHIFTKVVKAIGDQTDRSENEKDSDSGTMKKIEID